MTYDEQQQELDATMIVLGFCYAASLLILIAWVASRVF